jgi:hypothetical protein
MSELDDYRSRVTAARGALADTPLLGRGAPGRPDEATGERWDRGNVLGHVGEMLEYWTAQTRAVLGGAAEVGRGEAGYERRRQGIESGMSAGEEQLRERVLSGIDGLSQLLDEMRQEDLNRRIVYRAASSTRDGDLRYVLEELLVGHLEAHLRQLRELESGSV